jgi:hypothetical protein
MASAGVVLYTQRYLARRVLAGIRMTREYGPVFQFDNMVESAVAIPPTSAGFGPAIGVG